MKLKQCLERNFQHQILIFDKKKGLTLVVKFLPSETRKKEQIKPNAINEMEIRKAMKKGMKSKPDSLKRSIKFIHLQPD